MVELFAKSGDPDQTPHSAASDLGLQCLSITLFGVSRQQWVKRTLVTQGSILIQDVNIFYYFLYLQLGTDMCFKNQTRYVDLC